MRREISFLRILPTSVIGRFYAGDDGGGGAGGSGDGSGIPSGGEQPVGLTEAATKQVNELINKALGPRFKAFEEKQTKSFTDFGKTLTDSILGGLDEKLSALEPKPPTGKPKEQANDLSQNPEFRALKKQNEEIATQLAAERKEKLEATAKARSEALNRKVEAELANLGFADPVSARKLIVQGDQLAGYEADDSETIVFRDEEGGALPLKKGLESWSKSAVGKRFLPPSGANGSGERSGGGKKPVSSNGAAPTTDELGQALARELGLPLS